MLQIGIAKRRETPVFEQVLNGLQIDVLFDTGAELSVIDSRVGIQLFKRNVLVPSGMSTTLRSAVGKSSSAVYILREFNIGTIALHNLPVVLADIRRFKIGMILSSYVFKNNIFTISFNSSSILVDDSNKDIYVKAWQNVENKKISISVFVSKAEMESR